MSSITELTYTYLCVQPSYIEAKCAVHKVARKVHELVQRQGLPKTTPEASDLVEKALNAAVLIFKPIDFMALAYGQLENALQTSDEKSKRETIKKAIRTYQRGEMLMNSQKKVGHDFSKKTEPFSAKVKLLIAQIDPDNAIQNEIREEDSKIIKLAIGVGLVVSMMGTDSVHDKNFIA
jgi:hypothetical protein